MLNSTFELGLTNIDSYNNKKDGEMLDKKLKMSSETNINENFQNYIFS